MRFFFLLLLFSYKSIFCFVHIEKSCWCMPSIRRQPSSSVCGWRWWLKSSFLRIIWCVFESSSSTCGTYIVVRSDFTLISFFFFFFSFSFFIELRVGQVKNYTRPSISFVFWFSTSSLNCNSFIYMIVSK